MAAPRLDNPRTPTSMAAYYGAFLKALPKLLLSAAGVFSFGAAGRDAPDQVATSHGAAHTAFVWLMH